MIIFYYFQLVKVRLSYLPTTYRYLSLTRRPPCLFHRRTLMHEHTLCKKQNWKLLIRVSEAVTNVLPQGINTLRHID